MQLRASVRLHRSRLWIGWQRVINARHRWLLVIGLESVCLSTVSMHYDFFYTSARHNHVRCLSFFWAGGEYLRVCPFLRAETTWTLCWEKYKDRSLMMRWIEIDMLEKSEEAYQHLFVLDLLAPVRKKVLILIDFLFVSTFTKDIITPCRPNDIPSENSGLERQKE